jgi:hypothetical protein
VALRSAVRARKDLLAHRIGLANQLRAHLEFFYPGPVGLFTHLDAPTSLRFLARFTCQDDAGRHENANHHAAPRALDLVGRGRSRRAADDDEVGLIMRDPRAILSQASQGTTPSGWAVFTRRRGRVRGLLTGTSADPDPLLVITPEGVVEFVDNRKGIQVVDFDQLSEIALQIQGSSFSDSTIVHLNVWLELRYRDGRNEKWRSSTFAHDYRTIQSVLEAYGAHKALRGRG